jgi:hypothetical protein
VTRHNSSDLTGITPSDKIICWRTINGTRFGKNTR